MLLMDIREVKPDDQDFSLSIPLSILPGLNADSRYHQGVSIYGNIYKRKQRERLTNGVIAIAGNC